MDLKIVLIYCVCSDFLKKIGHSTNDSFQMSDDEVLTFAIVAALFFNGNHDRTRCFLQVYNYFPNMLSKSQLNRRLHAFDECLWRQILNQLSQILLHFESTNEYAIDSFPVNTCDTPRITRAKIFKGKEYHGYSSSKQRYFFGIKVHMLVSANKGIPIEIVFTPGSENDMRAFKRFTLDIPTGSTIYGDRAYNNYELEDFLSEQAEIKLVAQRRKNSMRPLSAELRYIQSRMRKRVETVFSQITGIFPRKVNAVTSKGFEIKIFNFILAYAFDLFFKEKCAFCFRIAQNGLTIFLIPVLARLQ